MVVFWSLSIFHVCYGLLVNIDKNSKQMVENNEFGEISKKTSWASSPSDFFGEVRFQAICSSALPWSGQLLLVLGAILALWLARYTMAGFPSPSPSPSFSPSVSVPFPLTPLNRHRRYAPNFARPNSFQIIAFINKQVSPIVGTGITDFSYLKIAEGKTCKQIIIWYFWRIADRIQKVVLNDFCKYEYALMVGGSSESITCRIRSPTAMHIKSCQTGFRPILQILKHTLSSDHPWRVGITATFL